MITCTVLKFRKPKITHQKNDIEQNPNRTDLSGSLSSIRSYKNIQQWTTDAKPIVHLLHFYSRVARLYAFGVIQSSIAHLKRSPLLPKHRQIVLPFTNACEIRPTTTCSTSCKPPAWTIALSPSPPANNPSRKASRDSSKSKLRSRAKAQTSQRMVAGATPLRSIKQTQLAIPDFRVQTAPTRS